MGTRSNFQKQAWLVLNITFIMIYTLYLASFILVLPFIKSVPRLLFNTILILSHLSALDHTKISIDQLSTNTTALLTIFFATNPGLLFLIPFYTLSIVNTVTALGKLKYKHQLLDYIETKKKDIVFASHFAEYLNVVPLLLGLVSGRSKISGVIIYCYILKISYTNEPVFKDVLYFLISEMDKRIHCVPPEYQKLYEKLKKTYGPS